MSQGRICVRSHPACKPPGAMPWVIGTSLGALVLLLVIPDTQDDPGRNAYTKLEINAPWRSASGSIGAFRLDANMAVTVESVEGAQCIVALDSLREMSGGNDADPVQFHIPCDDLRFED